MVIDEQGGARQPLTVKLAPGGLPPSGIGDGQVQAVLTEIVPEGARRQMSQRIPVVMDDHLGLAGRSAGEVHQHDIVIGIDLLGTMERRG